MKLLLIYIFLWIGILSGVKAQTITLIPKWKAQAQFAGYYVAEKLGFYKEEGLKVDIRHPSFSESSFSFMEKGDAQVTVMNLSYAFMERLAGAPIVNVMQTSQENSLLLIGRFPLKNINSLQGKKIAVWNHLSEQLLDRIADSYGLKVEWIRFNNGINLFLSGAVDICMIGSYNELIQLEECGVKIDSIYMLRFSDNGYDLPEDGLYVKEDFYNRHPKLIKKFVRASIRGWKWASEHREETLDIVMEEVRRHNVGTNRYHQRRMLEEILRLQVDKQSGSRTYHLSKEGFMRVAGILSPKNLSAKDSIRYEDFVK